MPSFTILVNYRCNQRYHKKLVLRCRWHIASATVSRARHTSALVHCISGLTAAIEGITGSWCLTAGGSIASATVPRARYTSALVHCISGLTAAIEGVTGS